MTAPWPTLSSVDPNTGQVLATVSSRDAEQTRAAVRVARRAQREWAARPLAARVRVMRSILEIFVAHADEIAGLVTAEMGKTETESLVTDVLLPAAHFNAMLRQAPRLLRQERLRQDILHFDRPAVIVYEPWGVVGIISPFNFPVLLSMPSAFAALIAGNAVVHKPSEFTPLTALRLAELCAEAGLPEGLLQVLPGDGRTGQALLESGLDYLVFVGGNTTGRRVAAFAGERMIPVTLELGGNNPMIVLEDAPLDRAADATLTYAFAMNGQMCGAVSRVYVLEAVADAFLTRLRDRAASWRVSTDVGPGRSEITALVSHVARQRVQEAVETAVAGGARAVCGGQAAASSAPIYHPTILIDIPLDSAVLREEIFGPVVCVLRVADEAEAIRRANDSPYGLTASVWSRDRRRAWSVARRLEVGSVGINDHVWPFFSPAVPWGGIKGSGIGRVGGAWSLRAMTYPKVISLYSGLRRREFYWPPASVFKHRLFRFLIPALYSRRPMQRLRAAGSLISTLVRRR